MSHKTPDGRDLPNAHVAFVVAVRLILLPCNATNKINEEATISRAGVQISNRCAQRGSRVTGPGSSGRPGNGAVFYHTHGLVANAWAPLYLFEHYCIFVSILGPKIEISVV